MGNSEKFKRYNRSAVFSAYDKQLRLEKWGKRFGNAQTAQHITSALISNAVTDAQVEETIQFIVDMFKAKGFTEEEAYKYMNANKRLITMSRSRLGSVLAMLSIANLSDKAFFEEPEFLQNRSKIARIYDAAKTVKASGDISLDAIRSILNNEEKEVEYVLTKDRLNFLYSSYMGRIKNAARQQGEKKELK